jgi:hypothetical protein
MSKVENFLSYNYFCLQSIHNILNITIYFENFYKESYTTIVGKLVCLEDSFGSEKY